MNDLESRIEKLTRANRRWKMLALCMFVGLCFFAVASFARARAMQAQAEEMRAVALQAVAAAERHRDTAEQP